MIRCISQILIFALMLVSGSVVGILARRGNAWKWIVAYWIILTVKNTVDFIGTIPN